MDVFIYSATATGVGRDEIEEALEAALEGVGEVTGGGAGTGGWNIDLEVSDCQEPEEVLAVVRIVLRRFGITEGMVQIAGSRHPL